jgi:hypothetical protein
MHWNQARCRGAKSDINSGVIDASRICDLGKRICLGVSASAISGSWMRRAADGLARARRSTGGNWWMTLDRGEATDVVAGKNDLNGNCPGEVDQLT